MLESNPLTSIILVERLAAVLTPFVRNQGVAVNGTEESLWRAVLGEA